MAIKSFKPYTPSRRNMTVSAFDGVDKKAKPERSLLEPLKKSSGRNSYGRITVRHRGGGCKRKYRIIDFRRDKLDMPAVVQRLEYDPNRSAFIALVKYEDGELRYMLAPYGLKAGDTVVSSAAAVRVVAGVHDGAADGRADAHVALAAGLAKVDVLMVDVADLADDCGAVHADETDFAGRETNLSQVAVLRHELSGRTGGADKLCAAAGVQLDVVDNRTNRNVGQRQAVARLDVGGG